MFPCNECAKAIIQSGINEVVYLSNKYAKEDNTKASIQMLKLARVTTRKLKPSQDKIQLSFQYD